MILLIDNYDSFAHNLYQLIGSLDPNVGVVRNDAISVLQIEAEHPDAIVLSPGPGRPADAGICVDVVRKLGSAIPILGVCLGHQAIIEAYGGTVGYAKELMHGKSSMVKLDDRSRLFAGLGPEMQVARYPSLAADSTTIPDELFVSAIDGACEVMAVEHVEHPVFGVQFHPESIMTSNGRGIVQNFLDIANDHRRKPIRL